jgi:hypothetical protein
VREMHLFGIFGVVFGCKSSCFVPFKNVLLCLLAGTYD